VERAASLIVNVLVVAANRSKLPTAIRRRDPSFLQELSFPAGSANQLAWLRIAVAGTILLLPEVRAARALASVDPALWVAPEGLGWFVRHVPVGPGIATGVQAACAASALCAIAGLTTRPALGSLTLSAFYLIAVGQLSGSVWHDMHLLWMSALLACSPSDEALTWDRRADPSAPSSASPCSSSARYGAPLFFARLLLGCIYFFPGIHKIARSGLAWALSDNLRNQLWWKWAEHGTVSSFRIDRYPALLHAGGLGVIAFELSMPLLVLTRRGRPWAALFGLAFHAGAQVFFGIPFASLWLLYVMLVDPHDIVRRLRRKATTTTVARARFTYPAVVAGIALFVAVAVQGIRGQTQAYPFACYPTFEWVAGTEMPDLILEVEHADGTRTLVPGAGTGRAPRSQRQWGEIWSLAGATAAVNPVRLRAYLESIRDLEPLRSALVGATAVRFYRGYLSVNPDDSGRPPRRGPLLCELTAPSGGEGNSSPQ
jgi:hypothetical protein